MRTGRPLLRCDKPGTLQKLLRRTSLPGPAPAWAANRRMRGKILGELSIPRPILTTIAQMTDSEAVMNLLRQVPLFANNLKDEDKVCIEETEEWRLPAGEMLFQEGQPGEHFFVLLEGEIATASFFSLRSRTMAAESRLEARPHIFAVPFFTTKGGSGTGLSLVISHRIVVERHHGKIDFSTGPDGTQFNVRLPFESPRTLSVSERPEYIVLK